ncbi:hypothetical protein RIF29_42050 [Crotalaria pallida]|uniref:Uncharacterized protein n=1 Tax=Crotalaria pallida TaxID=3830 RepID=A0AAN9HVX8_CROPI
MIFATQILFFFDSIDSFVSLCMINTLAILVTIGTPLYIPTPPLFRHPPGTTVQHLHWPNLQFSASLSNTYSSTPLE